MPADAKTLRSAAVEFVGCFIFILTICMAVNSGNAFAPLAIGSCLMVLVYIGGHVSGGHYNPAVSLGIFLRGADFDIVSMVIYMVAQILGGILGGLIAYALWDAMDGEQKWIAQIKPGADYGSGHAFFVELLYTFFLVNTVLNTATSDAKGYNANSFFGLAIGFSVVVGAYAVGGISGGAFNPAVAIGVTTGP